MVEDRSIESSLLELYGAAPSAEELDAALRHSGAGRLAPTKRCTSRAIALSVFAVLAVCAAAGAATALWPDPAPVVDNVDTFKDPAASPVSAAEYAAVQEYNLVPNTSRLGALGPDEMKQLIDLAPIEDSRVIVDDPDVGRLIAVPAKDRSSVCYFYTSPGPRTDRKTTGGCGLSSFPPSGVEAVLRESGSSQEVMGFAADDVEEVIVELVDGSTDNATMRRNAFYWKSNGIKAVGLRSKRAGFNETRADDVRPLHPR